MQTGHWLNISRQSSITTQILGLIVVCTVAIPILILIMTAAIVLKIFKN